MYGYLNQLVAREHVSDLLHQADRQRTRRAAKRADVEHRRVHDNTRSELSGS
jgi:hypothetical protein